MSGLTTTSFRQVPRRSSQLCPNGSCTVANVIALPHTVRSIPHIPRTTPSFARLHQPSKNPRFLSMATGGSAPSASANHASSIATSPTATCDSALLRNRAPSARRLAAPALLSEWIAHLSARRERLTPRQQIVSQNVKPESRIFFPLNSLRFHDSLGFPPRSLAPEMLPSLACVPRANLKGRSKVPVIARRSP